MLSWIFVFVNEYSTSNTSTFTGTEKKNHDVNNSYDDYNNNNSNHNNTGDNNNTDDNTVYTTNNFDRADFTTFYNICQFTICIVNVL